MTETTEHPEISVAAIRGLTGNSVKNGHLQAAAHGYGFGFLLFFLAHNSFKIRKHDRKI